MRIAYFAKVLSTIAITAIFAMNLRFWKIIFTLLVYMFKIIFLSIDLIDFLEDAIFVLIKAFVQLTSLSFRNKSF
jgi:hypothetical protein